MPVFAMKCIDKAAHEKTDSLFIYQFESPALGQLQIVANLTNVYEVGDIVAIAQLGTRLPGVVLKPRKVYGIPSQGMALGPVEAGLDDDLSAQFDADASPVPLQGHLHRRGRGPLRGGRRPGWRQGHRQEQRRADQH